MGSFVKRPTEQRDTTRSSKNANITVLGNHEVTPFDGSRSLAAALRIEPGEESRTEYVPVQRERGGLAGILFGDRTPTMVPVRRTSKAVERSNDGVAVAENIRRVERLDLDRAREYREAAIGKIEDTIKLKGLHLRELQVDFQIELELEQQESDRQTFAEKRRTDQFLAGRDHFVARQEQEVAEGNYYDAATTKERKRQQYVKAQEETRKLAARAGVVVSNVAPPDDNQEDIEAMARRATLAAVAGSVTPTTPDRYAYPMAGCIFLTYYLQNGDLAGAERETSEAMACLYADVQAGRTQLTREKADDDFTRYQELRAQAEESGDLNRITKYNGSFVRPGGTNAFSDPIND